MKNMQENYFLKYHKKLNNHILDDSKMYGKSSGTLRNRNKSMTQKCLKQISRSCSVKRNTHKRSATVNFHEQKLKNSSSSKNYNFTMRKDDISNNEYSKFVTYNISEIMQI